jgi:hypothetical protein
VPSFPRRRESSTANGADFNFVVMFNQGKTNMKQPVVYILASQQNGTLYVGVTSNLVQRVWQH